MNTWIPQTQKPVKIGSVPTAQVGTRKLSSLQKENIDPRTAFLDYKDQFEFASNMKAFGGVNSSGRKMEAQSRLFNNQNVLNASDKKDAITQLQHYSEVLAQGGEQLVYKKAAYTAEQEDTLYRKAFSSESQRSMYAAQAAIPFRLRLDYEGFIRKVLLINTLKQGEINRIDLDVESSAVMLSPDGHTPEVKIEGDVIYPATKQIGSWVTIAIEEVQRAQWNKLQRAEDRTVQEMSRMEDQDGIRMLYEASTVSNSQVTIPATLNMAALEAIAFQVEQSNNELYLDKYLINRAELTDIRTTMALQFDPVTQREILMTGLFGNIMGYDVYVSLKTVPAGFIFGVTAPEYLGVLSLILDIQSFAADQFPLGKSSYGFFYFLLESMVIANTKAVALGRKSGSTLAPWMI